MKQAVLRGLEKIESSIDFNPESLKSRGGGRGGRLSARQGSTSSYAPAVPGLPPVPSGRVLVDLEVSVKDLAEMLTSGPEPLQVVTILGIPGQGSHPCCAWQLYTVVKFNSFPRLSVSATQLQAAVQASL